jgi:hypothetical protein
VATSTDGGRTFEPFRTGGLEHGYCTAIALAGDAVVVGSSGGPLGETVLYRGGFGGGDFERVGREVATVEPVLARNLLLAIPPGPDFAFGSGRSLWRSTDGGATWTVAAEEGADIRCVGRAG